MKWCITFIKTLANVTCATFYLIANHHYENHSSDIRSIRFKHTRIIRFFGLLKKYLKILDTKANFQAFVSL